MTNIKKEMRKEFAKPDIDRPEDIFIRTCNEGNVYYVQRQHLDKFDKSNPAEYGRKAK